MVTRYAIIRNGVVENVCQWDGVVYSPETGVGWIPPEGCETIRLDETICDIGWIWDGKEFKNPAENVNFEEEQQPAP